jgi:hypothetical protein
VTSFLAIDEESRREVHPATSIQHEDYNEQRHDPPMVTPSAPYAPGFITLSPSPPAQSFLPGRPQTSAAWGSPQVVGTPSLPVTTSARVSANSSWSGRYGMSYQYPRPGAFVESYDPAMYSQEEFYDPTISDSSFMPEEHSTIPNHLYQRVESQGDVNAMPLTGGATPSPFSRVLSFVKKKKRSSTSSFPELQGSRPPRASSSSYATVDTAISSPNAYNPPLQRIHTLSSSPIHSAPLPDLASVSQQPGSSGLAAFKQKAKSTSPVTLESIVRAQQFNGSFPSDSAFLAQICGNKPVPSMPAALRDAQGKGRTESVKLEIWATVLVLACLRRKFAVEKDSWEIVAEKAMVFVKDALGGIGVGDAGPFRDTLIADAEGLF